MVELREGSALLHLMGGGRNGPGSGHGPRSTDGVRSKRPSTADRRPPSASDSAGALSGSGAVREAGRRAGDAAAAANERRSAVGHPRSGERSEPVTCGFCGTEFVEDPTQAVCQACPLNKGCSLMRCPNCGFENAKEPSWLAKLKEWIG